MPILVSEVKTQSGSMVVRAEFVKEVTLADAKSFMERAGVGTRYESAPFLITGNITGVSAEVKKALTPEVKPKNPGPIAVVLDSAIARMVAGLLMRLSGEARSEYFKTEADALAWLDGR